VNSKLRHVLEDGVSGSSAEYHAEFAAPHSSSKGRVSSLEYELIMQLERQLSESLTAQTERDQCIAQLTDELAVKSAQLELAEANAAEAAKRAGLKLCEHADRLLMQTSLVKQRDAELVDVQAKLDELVVSHDQQDQQVGRYKEELTNVRTELKAKESELEAVRLRHTEAENSLTKSKTKADTLRAQTATGSVNRDEDKVTRLMERMRALESEVASKRWNEKSIEEMECRNEG
jgi:chromosome segregation ATPase